MINPPTTAAPSILNEKQMEVDGNDGKDGQNSRPYITLSGVDGGWVVVSDSPALLAGNVRERKSRRSQ